MKKIWEMPKECRAREPFKPDGVLTFSKENSVGHQEPHESDQQPHLKVADTNVCSTDCAWDYGNPCEKFCPAAVYEMVDSQENPEKELFIHHENRVTARPATRGSVPDHHLDDAAGRRGRLHRM